MFCCFATFVFGCAKPQTETKTANDAVAQKVPKHAEMTLFMMATCPHCAQAMRDVLPLYQKLNGALSLNVEYIGTVDENGFPDLAHGDLEVASAIIEICAVNAVEESQGFSFMECLYKDDLWRDIPANWKECAQKNNIPYPAVEKCIKDGAGEGELVRSIATSAAEGVQAAPTLVIDEKEFVGPLTESFLLTHLCYFSGEESTRPEQCEGIEKPKPLNAVLLQDARCGEQCNVTREVEFITALFPAMEIEPLDYSTPEGTALFDQIVADGGPAAVPTLYIMETIDDLGPAAIPLSQYMMEFNEGLLLPLALGFDPSKEICDNGRDDDDNELVDCADEYCTSKLVCRPTIQNRLDVFVMSQCPYAAMLVPAIDHLVKHLRENKSLATLRFQFIGSEKDGVLYSMHGKSEVEENKRMACVQELYAEDHAFMSYMLCRAANYQDNNWQKCLSDKMKEKEVDACATGVRGHELVAASYRMADAVGKNGSPTWLLNNTSDMQGRTSSQILEAYCAVNEDPACDSPIKPLLIDKSLPPVEQCE